MIDKTGWQPGDIEPGKVCLEPAGVNGGQDYAFSLLQGGINLVSSGYSGISYQLGEAFTVQNEDKAKGSRKLQIYFSQEPQLTLVIHFGKNRREILIGNLDAKGEDHPSEITDGCAHEKDNRNGEKIDKKNN